MKLTKISSSIRVAFPLGGPCPHCGKFIEDLLAEMVSDSDKRTENYQDLIWQRSEERRVGKECRIGC